MFNLLNFFVYLVWTSCGIARPLKGIQCSDPKAKGNITVVMLPQGKNGGNDSDVIFAVKSDYKVLSQNIKLLNLVVQDNQQNNMNHSKIECTLTSPKQPSTRCKNTTEGSKTAKCTPKYKEKATTKDKHSKRKKPNTVNTFKPIGHNNIRCDNDSSINLNASTKDESGESIFIFSKMSNAPSKIADENIKNNQDNREVLNIPRAKEYSLFLELLNTPLNKENDKNYNEVSLSSADRNKICQPLSTLNNTSLEGALDMLNKLKGNPSPYASIVHNREKFIKQEENKFNPQNTNRDEGDTVLTMDEEGSFVDDSDCFDSGKKEKSSNEGNVSSVVSNYTHSICLPFFIDPKSTELACTNGSTESTVINCSNADNLSARSYNKSCLLAHLIPRDVGSISESNNELNNEGNSKLASLLNKNEVKEINEKGWLLSAENQQPDAIGAEIANEETTCTTTIIVKCNTVQDNKVFEQISKMVNVQTTVTEGEVKNSFADIEVGTESTKTGTVATECFPVNRNNINAHVTNVVVGRKVTQDPPVECPSHIHAPARQTCEPYTEQDVRLQGDYVELSLVKSVDLLASNHERANNRNVPINFEVKYRLPDVLTRSGKPNSEAPKVSGNNESRDMGGSNLQPVIQEHEDIGKMLLFPPINPMEGNYAEKNSYFGKEPSFRTGMNNDNNNNQCDSKGRARIEHPNLGMDPDDGNSEANDTQSNMLLQKISSTEKENENFTKLYSITSTEQRSSSNEAKCTLSKIKPLVPAESEKPVYTTVPTVDITTASVCEHSPATQFVTVETSRSITENCFKFPKNKTDFNGVGTEHNLNEFDITTVTNLNAYPPFCPTLLNKPKEIYNNRSDINKTDDENKVPFLQCPTVNHNKHTTYCSTIIDEQSDKRTTSECFRKHMSQDKLKISTLFIKTTKINTLRDSQDENKNFKPTESLSLFSICENKSHTTKFPLHKYICASPTEKLPVKVPTITNYYKKSSTTCKGNSGKVRNLLLNNLPFGMNPKYQSIKKQEGKSDIRIPVGSVKEIVIQIIQNTKAPDIDYKTHVLKV